MYHVKSFRKTFKIDKNASLNESEVAIDSTAKAYKTFNEFIDEVAPTSAEDGFRIRSLANLVARVYEHVQGMLVAISTGSPSSAEALGRVIVEGSINIIYLAKEGDAGTLIKYFESWLKEHDRKLDEWKEKIQKEPHADIVSEMIEKRRKVVHTLTGFVREVELQCAIDLPSSKSDWPKSLYKRFEVLGRETDYYESYHRLSGSSHLTGEDTLMWFMFRLASAEQALKAGKEAWAYSIMMTRIAGVFFIDAIIACAEAYGRTDNADLDKYRLNLRVAVQEIARRAGVPID